jgi:hypothetical protein
MGRTSGLCSLVFREMKLLKEFQEDLLKLLI